MYPYLHPVHSDENNKRNIQLKQGTVTLYLKLQIKDELYKLNYLCRHSVFCKDTAQNFH